MTERSRAARLGARLVEGVEARLALFGFELGEERDRLLAVLVSVLVAVVLLFVGLLSLNVLLVLVFWPQRVLVAAIVTVLYLGLGAGLALAARARMKNSPQPFSATLEELRKDADSFGTAERSE